MPEGTLLTRNIVEPNSPVTVGGDPALNRGFILRDIQNWSSHPHELPSGVVFQESDKDLGHGTAAAWEEMQFKGPIHCNDAFIIRRSAAGTFETLTAVRKQWPLPGERWMIGGREVTPPANHPLADEWLPDHSMLLSIYREANLQPSDIRRAYRLLEIQLNFKSPKDPTKMKQTPATLWVLEAKPQASVDLDARELVDPIWIDLAQIDDAGMDALKLTEYMKFALSKVQAEIAALV